jgi:hypothetical protein
VTPARQRVRGAFASSHSLSIRQHTSAYVSIRDTCAAESSWGFREFATSPPPGSSGELSSQLFARPFRIAPCIRQHTSAYVSIRQHTSAYASICTSAYVRVVQQALRSHLRMGSLHTSAYVSIRQHTSAYVSIRQHTSAYVSVVQPALRSPLADGFRAVGASVFVLLYQ